MVNKEKPYEYSIKETTWNEAGISQTSGVHYNYYFQTLFKSKKGIIIFKDLLVWVDFNFNLSKVKINEESEIPKLSISFLFLQFPSNQPKNT